MANVNVTSDSWTEISITSGTIQNISATADIELSAEQTDNSGVVLKPSELYQWDNETIYARAVTEETGALRVVNFKKAAGGGGGYVLPVATASKLGGVKIGSNISIDANGVISTHAPYSLPPAAAGTLGGVKVGNNLSIDENGVLSATGGGGSTVDIKKTVAAAPAYYEREQLYNTNKTTITIYPTWVNIDDSGFFMETTKLLDIETADNWDDGQYTTAANRAGKDFYIYACKSSGNAPDFILSANSTIPAGYTSTNSRKIGGFHCLCVAVGTISGHTLSGYIEGDILPQSPWDLKHRAISENEGMVYVPEVNKWVDIYLPSYDGAKLVSEYNSIIADGTSTPNFHGEKFVEYFGLVKKQLPSRDNFVVFAKGSNEGTNILGSADPNTTGGHVDTNNRRMISNYGIEDCCGALWQWTNDCPENYPGSTWNASSTPYWMGGYDWQSNPVYNPNCDTQSYGSCTGLLRRLFVGGAWSYSSACGSRCVYADSFGSRLYENMSSRGCSNSRI